MDIAVNPILLIGMGGTGRNVVNRFRRRLRQRVGTDRLPFIQYLYVDTDDGNLEAKSEASGISIGIGPQDGAELVRDLSSPLAMELELQDGLYPQTINLLNSGSTGGAKGVRQLGHVSFLASKNLLTLQTKIRNALQGLFGARTQHVGQPLEGVEPAYLTVRPQVCGHVLRVYVIASAGGGTGSSTFADMGYFVRWASAGQAFENHTRLFGMVGLASNWVTEDKLRGNSAGVLTELNHYLTGKGYRAAYPVSFPHEEPIRPGRTPLAGRPPFDFTYVLEPSLYQSGALFNDPQVDVKSQRAMELLEQKIAEFLLSEAVYSAADGTMALVDNNPPTWVGTLLNEHLSRLEDIASRSAESRYRQSYPAVLMTLGVTTREVPAVMHHKLAFGMAVRKLATRWAKVPVPPAGAATDDLGDEQANELLRKWRRRLGAHEDPALYRAHRAHETGGDGLAGDELARLILGVETGDEVRATLRGMCGRPQLVAGQTFQEGDWLREASGRINTLCMEVPDTPVLTSAGGIHARLRDRGKRLAAFDLEEGLPRQLAGELLALAFDRDGGAGAALACARALLERASREAAFVTECRESVPTGGAAPAAGARGPVGDWLLAIAVGVAHPAPDPSRVVRLAWEHANRTLLRLVLQAKEVVLAQIMVCLQRMISRLELLGDYYGRWAANTPELESPEFRLSAEEQQYVLLDRERLDEFSDLRSLRVDLQSSPLYRRLLAQVVRGLPPVDDEGHPPVDAEGREDIFVAGLPRDRRSNEVDFSYLQEIERSIFDSIGSRDNGPYQMEVIDLLQRQAQRDRVQLAPFAAESAPLLQFNAGDQYYRRDCPFGDSVDYWALIYDQSSVGVDPFLAQVRATETGYQFPDRPAAVRLMDSHIPSVFTEVRSRGGVVSTLIAGYDATTARNLTDHAIVPPFVDSRIRAPLDPELLFQAGVRLLGGALLGPKVVLDVAEQGSGFEFLYQLQVGRMLSQQSRHFTPDFNEAQALLATLPIELEQIDLSIKGRVQADRDAVGQRITKVSEMINAQLVGNLPDCQAHRLDLWGDLEKPSGVYFENLEFGNAFSLLSAFVTEYNVDCQLKMDHNHAAFKRAGDPLANGGTAQVGGFYCKFGPSCGAYLGSVLPSNNHPCRVCNNTGVPQR